MFLEVGKRKENNFVLFYGYKYFILVEVFLGKFYDINFCYFEVGIVMILFSFSWIVGGAFEEK